MKRKYIQPALVQVMLMTKKTFVINTSLQVDNNAQNDVSGDVKELVGDSFEWSSFDWDDSW